MGVIITYSVLTYMYVKYNTLEDSVELKKSVVKLLVYFCIVAVFSFIGGLLPAATHAIGDAAMASGGTVGFLAVDYSLNIIYLIPSLATPMVAIIFLKPIRDALKTTAKKIFCLRNDTNGADTNNTN